MFLLFASCKTTCKDPGWRWPCNLLYPFVVSIPCRCLYAFRAAISSLNMSPPSPPVFCLRYIIGIDLQHRSQTHLPEVRVRSGDRPTYQRAALGDLGSKSMCCLGHSGEAGWWTLDLLKHKGDVNSLIDGVVVVRCWNFLVQLIVIASSFQFQEGQSLCWSVLVGVLSNYMQLEQMVSWFQIYELITHLIYTSCCWENFFVGHSHATVLFQRIVLGNLYRPQPSWFLLWIEVWE